MHFQEVLLAQGDGTSSARRRVVIFSRNGQAPDAGVPAGVDVVCAGGAYEAAAELLAAPAAALVLDLGLLRERHLGLLRVARQTGAAMLAYGTARAAMDAEQLAGVQLVARAELAERLAKLVCAEPAPSSDRPFSREPAVKSTVSAAEDAAAPARLVPAKTSAATQQNAEERLDPPVDLALEEEPPATEKKQQDHGQDAHATADAHATPGSLLSADELSALLGEEGK